MLNNIVYSPGAASDPPGVKLLKPTIETRVGHDYVPLKIVRLFARRSFGSSRVEFPKPTIDTRVGHDYVPFGLTLLIKGNSKSNHLDAHGTFKGALQRYAIFLFEIRPAHVHERASTKRFVVYSGLTTRVNPTRASGSAAGIWLLFARVQLLTRRREHLHARALQIRAELSTHIPWRPGPMTNAQFLEFSF